MHLAIVSPFPPTTTGIGQYGYHITRKLAQLGVFSRITVLAGSHMNGERPNHLGMTEIEYCWQPDNLNARESIRTSIKRLNPDLVWFNLGASVFGKSPWTNISGSLSPLAIQKMGFPTVVTLHELIELTDLRALNAPGGLFAKWGARLITDIITNTDVVCLTMQKYMNWFVQKRPNIECMHIPLGAFDAPDLMPEADSDELLLFTTLAPFKGLEILLESFNLLKDRFPKLKLTIAGAEHIRFPNYAKSLKSEIDNIEDIQWLGEIPEENLMELFRKAKIIVLPYLASTGSSSVLLRAATWGRAVIASDIKDMRDLAQESNFEIEFFNKGNVASLVKTIELLLSSPERRMDQVQKNFLAIQKIRIETTCERYLKAFNRALEKRKSLARINSPYFNVQT